MPRHIHHQHPTPLKYQLSSIQLDSALRRVTRNGETIALTNLEFMLLEYLFQHADTICKRDEILDHVWGQQFQYDTGTIDVHLHSLRRKLGFSRRHPIESIRSMGIILHTKPQTTYHPLNIQAFITDWLMSHEKDFNDKQLIPQLHLDPFISEITLSPEALRAMLDGILQVLLPVSQPGVIHVKSKLTYLHFHLSLDINGTINELRIPINNNNI